MSSGFSLDDVTLDNIADGLLNEQFQARMFEVAQVLASRDGFVADKQGTIKVVIPMEVALSCARDGSVTVAISTGLKIPKRLSASRPIYFKGNRWLTMPEKQGQLIDTTNQGQNFAVPPVPPPED